MFCLIRLQINEIENPIILNNNNYAITFKILILHYRGLVWRKIEHIVQEHSPQHK